MQINGSGLCAVEVAVLPTRLPSLPFSEGRVFAAVEGELQKTDSGGRGNVWQRLAGSNMGWSVLHECFSALKL